MRLRVGDSLAAEPPHLEPFAALAHRPEPNPAQALDVQQAVVLAQPERTHHRMMSHAAKDRTPDKYDVRAENWAQGMRASQSLTAIRRAQAQPMAVANRAAGAKRPCGIKGCQRHSFKGRLCRQHYAMVPHVSKLDAMMAQFEASSRVSQRFHRRYLREVRALVE